MPTGANMGSLYGTAVLCGVGFTMSMFVGSLAFESEHTGVQILFDERMGIIVGSLMSALLAAVILKFSLPKPGLGNAS
jgi:NhaA family Na+:H+ antiporter